MFQIHLFLEEMLAKKTSVCVWNAALQGAEYFYYFGTQYFAAGFGLRGMQFCFG